eukprot:COSAG06_NODE_7899_length_2338_cov_1.818222_1_plen_277_part_00
MMLQGKFGIGFNSVYHVTDMPSFITGDHLYLFDPHRTNLPGGHGGASLAFEHYQTCESQFAPYMREANDADESMEFLPSKPESGKGKVPPEYPYTMFRLPFRTARQAPHSNIQAEQFTEATATEIMELFAKEAQNMCLFLKHIKSIRLSVWEDGSDKPRQMCLVSAADSDEAEAQKIPHVLETPEVMDTIKANLASRTLIESNFVRDMSYTDGDGVTTVQRYLVCNRLGTDTGADACLTILQDPKLRLLPLAGIAAPLDPVKRTIVRPTKDHTELL